MASNDCAWCISYYYKLRFIFIENCNLLTVQCRPAKGTIAYRGMLTSFYSIKLQNLSPSIPFLNQGIHFETIETIERMLSFQMPATIQSFKKIVGLL